MERAQRVVRAVIIVIASLLALVFVAWFGELLFGPYPFPFSVLNIP